MLGLAALLGLLATTPPPTAPVTVGIFRSGDTLNITAADLDFRTAAGGDVHVNGLPLAPVVRTPSQSAHPLRMPYTHHPLRHGRRCHCHH